MQIRIEMNKTRSQPHLRGRFRDFGKLDDWSNNKLCFRSTTRMEFVHRTGRAVGLRRRRGLTQTPPNKKIHGGCHVHPYLDEVPVLHLRGRFRDFGKLDDWSNNKLCFRSTTRIEFVL
jgi:hypothetical protein